MILNNLLKTKKPIVLVTSKNDNRNKYKIEYFNEIEKLIQQRHKEYQKYMYQHVIETSSHLNINVNQPFLIIASMLNKQLNKNRQFTQQIQHVLKYNDAYYIYNEMCLQMKSYLKCLLVNEIKDYKSKYEQFYAKKHKELKQLIDFFGIDFIVQQFNQHVAQLKHEYIKIKLNIYLKQRLAYLIENIFYNNQSDDRLFYLNNTWFIVKENIKKHKLFNKYILTSEDAWQQLQQQQQQEQQLAISSSLDTSPTKLITQSHPQWYENDYFDLNKLTLPYEIFDLNECQIEFDILIKTIKDENKKYECKKDLLNLLYANITACNIKPGTTWIDANTYLLGRECYEYLCEDERKQVYEEFQKDLILKAKLDYKELLNENIELLLRKLLIYTVDNSEATTTTTTMSSSLNDVALKRFYYQFKSPTHNDINEIMNDLRENDERHKFLDKLNEERKGLLLKHIAFLMNLVNNKTNNKAYCSYGKLCIDNEISKYLLKQYQLFFEKYKLRHKKNHHQNHHHKLFAKNLNFILVSNKKFLINTFINRINVSLN